jgi:hypothetical protein
LLFPNSMNNLNPGFAEVLLYSRRFVAKDEGNKI